MDAGAYLQEHSKELSRKYPGKYVAVVDGEIVAVASSAAIAYKKAKSQFGDKEIAVFYMSSEEENVILTMNAAGPTTRSALSLYKFIARPFNPVTPRLLFLGGLDPADPLIAREWRNILPCCQRSSGRSKGLS